MSNPNVNLDPAKTVIDKIGGIDQVVKITGKHYSWIYRWMYPRGERGGTGGFIPHRDAIKLLDYAKQHDIPLSAEDFIQSPAPAPERESAA